MASFMKSTCGKDDRFSPVLWVAEEHRTSGPKQGRELIFPMHSRPAIGLVY